jgi:hypothetical protein
MEHLVFPAKVDEAHAYNSEQTAIEVKGQIFTVYSHDKRPTTSELYTLTGLSTLKRYITQQP